MHCVPTQVGLRAFPRARVSARAPSILRPRSLKPRIPSSRFSTTAVEHIGEPGLISTLSSVLVSSPLSAGATVILLTLLVRSGVTLPATLWQRARVRRTRELVQPEMKRLNEELAVSLARECKREGKSYDEYKKALKGQLATHQMRLHKQHSTHPLLTMFLPLAVHVPVLITLSLTIRGAIDSGAWSQEAFAWIPHLGEPDASVILPLIGGMAAMANAEMAGRRRAKEERAGTGDEGTAPLSTTAGASSALAPTTPPATTSTTRRGPVARSDVPIRPQPHRPPQRPFSTSPLTLGPKSKSAPPSRVMSPVRLAALQREREREQAQQGQQAASAPKLSSMTPAEQLERERERATIRQKFIAMVLRGGAVIFIPFAATVPSALALYWTSSMVYTLCQNAILDHLEK